MIKGCILVALGGFSVGMAREGIGGGCVNLFCMGIRENSTVRLGASTIMGVDLPISID
jgi:hypothetical protein